MWWWWKWAQGHWVQSQWEGKWAPTAHTYKIRQPGRCAQGNWIWQQWQHMWTRTHYLHHCWTPGPTSDPPQCPHTHWSSLGSAKEPGKSWEWGGNPRQILQGSKQGWIHHVIITCNVYIQNIWYRSLHCHTTTNNVTCSASISHPPPKTNGAHQTTTLSHQIGPGWHNIDHPHYIRNHKPHLWWYALGVA